MLNVMFVCCAGMSTSLLVAKLDKAVKERGLDWEICAMAEAEARQKLSQADVLLLGPQVSYLQSGFRKELEGTKTKLGVVDMRAYGLLDAEKIIVQIKELAEL